MAGSPGVPVIRRAATARAACTAAVLIAAVACATGAPQHALPAHAQVDDDTTLRSGDSFDVAVYGEADLSGKHRVDEDGAINFPLVGKMKVEGKSAVAIADLIRDALAQHGILRSPNVTVYVIERRSKQITFMGAVAKPGSYKLTTGMSLIQALGAAGGLTALARGSDAVLTRLAGEGRQRFRVDIESITEGRSADFSLQAGDILYVPVRVF
ncbi:MAG TPA: polysaccharide biosynthesis/export family protein [Polyangiales bacterium]|nr:polysaccharide biosynthesis/export family protein [Polyangiales bacterium]